MSSNRYPKRRRVSARTRAPTPPEEVQRYSSPDELAATSDHEKYMIHRNPSLSKRGPKERKKSLASTHEVATTTVIPKTEPNTFILNRAEPEVDAQGLTATEASPDIKAPSVSSISVVGSPENLNPLTSQREDSPDELAIDHTLPTFYRTSTTSTFRGSFSKAARQAPPRHKSPTKSPPPYSRISTPISVPHTPPPRPPQYVPYKQKMVLKGHKRGVAAVKVSPDGRLIASCSADATIRIWDTATGKQLHTLEGHLAGISTIAWSPDSKTLASGSDDKSIRLWDASTGKPHPHPFKAHSSYVYALSFSPHGNMLASGSYDEALFLWDVRAACLMRSLPAHSDPIGGVDFVRDGTLIVSCAGDGLIRVWDTASGQCLRTLVHEDNAPVTSVCFSPNGKYILAWTLDSSIRLWDYVDGRCVKTYLGHKNEKYSISGAFGVYTNEDETEKRAYVVSASEDGKIFAWDVQGKDILQEMDGHEGVVLGVDTAKGGQLMVSGGIDKTVRVWEREKEEVDVKAEAKAEVNTNGNSTMLAPKEEEALSNGYPEREGQEPRDEKMSGVEGLASAESAQAMDADADVDMNVMAEMQEAVDIVNRDAL